MKRALQIVVFLALAAAGYFAWMWLHPPPEQAIRKQMEKLSETLVGKPGEGNFARVAGINKTLSFFTPDIVIDAEAVAPVNESIQGKTELQQALFAARSRLDGAITFQDMHVKVAPEATNAVVMFTAIVRLTDQNEPYSHDFKAQFVKVDNSWLIARVEAPGLKPLPSEGK